MAPSITHRNSEGRSVTVKVNIRGTSNGPHQRFDAGRALLLLFCVGGTWAAYLWQGVLQETLSTRKFGPDGERFVHLSFLNLLQSVVCLIWAYAAVLIFAPTARRGGRPGSSSVCPLLGYWRPSITNTIGPACGLEALKYISYPAQVVAKSSKMIPVMLVGTFVYGKFYTLPEYLCTLLIVAGVSIFALFKGTAKATRKLLTPNAPLGYSLCFINLFLDGYTNTTQDNLKLIYPKTSRWDLMVGMNAWGSLYLGLYMFLAPGGGGADAVLFCLRNPEAGWDILMYCLCGVVGQSSIFLTISEFGSLASTTITTTRKFMSILISALWTGNPLTQEQWVGVAITFLGLGYSIYLKWRRTRAVGRKDAD